MTIHSINDSQRAAARVAGVSYLITFAIVVYVNFAIHNRLIASKNIAETARNILAHETLFRVGIAGDLIYCVGIVVLLVALYVILEPANKGLALLAAFWRFVWSLAWLVMTLNLFDAMRLLRGVDQLAAVEARPVLAVAKVYLASRFDYYYVGLLFGALASTACGYLWLKSRYIPRPLATLGIVTSAFGVACTFTFLIFPNFDNFVNLWLFDAPMGIFDIALSFWLLIKGLRPPLAADAGNLQNAK